MTRRWRSTVMLQLLGLLLLLSPGCGEGKATPDTPRPTPGTEAAAVPAENGKLCAEHGVPESMCTKCNPRLIAIFKAKGDWCEEHGFPESVCPICHPGRNGKAADGAPADGTKVHLKGAETARKAGIETARAEARPEGAGIVATATIAFDATRWAVVNARAPGVIRGIQADIGARVVRGAPLAVIDSADVGADRSRLQAARTRLEVAEARYQRQKTLQADGIAAMKDVLDALQEQEAARAEVASASAALGVVGKGAGASGYTLVAPLAGQVISRQATVGRLVGTEEVLFEIADTSTMWAEIDVPEDELLTVAVGQAVVVTVDALGDREFRGTLSYVSPAVDRRTRTAKARAALANPDGLLRANMFARARVVVGGSASTVTVPSQALQRIGDVFLVFVRRAADEFEVRRVEVGASEGALVEITKGLAPGEEVVTAGSFLLKTETLKDSLGAGCVDD